MRCVTALLRPRAESGCEIDVSVVVEQSRVVGWFDSREVLLCDCGFGCCKLIVHSLCAAVVRAVLRCHDQTSRQLHPDQMW